MTTITIAQQNKTTLFSQWFAEGWKLFLKAPIKLILTLLAVMVVAGLFQILPAPTGVIISKWVGACLSVFLWPLLDQLAKTGVFSFKSFSKYTGWKYVPVIGLLLMLPFMFQVAFATSMLGAAGFNLIIFGDIASITPLQVATIFASAAPLMVLMMFVPAYLLLDNQSPKNAVLKGVDLVLKAWQPMLLLVIINAIVLFLAPFTFALSALLLSPLLICVNYQAFQSLSNR